jgi:hypothetical protein
MNGTLVLPLRAGKSYTVMGGSFYECPPKAVGVKMAAEIDRVCHIDIPTHDFKTPDKQALDRGLIDAVMAITMGRPVYVGCMAGRGRTGLFLSILAKAFSIENPVEYVREHYYPHAVETDSQYKFVMDYLIPWQVHAMLWNARFWSYIPFWSSKENLTNLEGVI